MVTDEHLQIHLAQWFSTHDKKEALDFVLTVRAMQLNIASGGYDALPLASQGDPGMLNLLETIAAQPVSFHPDDMIVAKQSNTHNTRRAKKIKARKAAASQANANFEGKKMKPVNSFMAFRTYYSRIFDTFHQSFRSGIFSGLWEEDQFRAKWTILASAYSDMRDFYGKDMCPFDKFLALSAPFIGIINPEHYLEKLGWVYSHEGDDTYLARAKVVPTFTMAEKTTNISVQEVIDFCLSNGYPSAELAILADETSAMNNNHHVTINMVTVPTHHEGDQMSQCEGSSIFNGSHNNNGVHAEPEQNVGGVKDGAPGEPEDPSGPAGAEAKNDANHNFDNDLYNDLYIASQLGHITPPGSFTCPPVTTMEQFEHLFSDEMDEELSGLLPFDIGSYDCDVDIRDASQWI